MPLRVFYSYAHEDEELRDHLNEHLSILHRTGLIEEWHDRAIGAGDDWRAQIDTHAREAHIVLLLISPSFLASDYCYDTEMKLALSRNGKGEAIVVPIILRPVDWSGAPFAHLQALPRNAKAVTLWQNQDEALADVARGIREVVQRFRPPPSGSEVLVDEKLPRSRVLDAAMPSHIVKGEATEIDVLVRLPESPGLKGILQSDEGAEAGPEDVLSKDFKLTFPTGVDGKPEALKATVMLEALDFTPSTQSKQFFIPPDGDSNLLQFMMTPNRTGKLPVLVELRWEEAVRGSRRLRTECIAEAGGLPAKPGKNILQLQIEVEKTPSRFTTEEEKALLTGAKFISSLRPAGAQPALSYGHPPSMGEPPPPSCVQARPHATQRVHEYGEVRGADLAVLANSAAARSTNVDSAGGSDLLAIPKKSNAGAMYAVTAVAAAALLVVGGGAFFSASRAAPSDAAIGAQNPVVAAAPPSENKMAKSSRVSAIEVASGTPSAASDPPKVKPVAAAAKAATSKPSVALPPKASVQPALKYARPSTHAVPTALDRVKESKYDKNARDAK